MLALDRGDLWYRHVVRRQLKRAQLAEQTDVPGVVFLEIDGLAHDVLRRALRDGNAPVLARWMHDGGYRLEGWETDWSSQTGACQAGLLHGSDDDMPAFRWWEKDTGRAIVTNHPRDAAEIERRRSDGRGLLHADGASRANILSGDAPHSMLTMSTVLDRKRQGRLGQDYFAYFASPYGVARTLLRVIGEVFVERWSAIQQVRRDVRPRIKRDWKYALVRAYATVIQLDLQVAAVTADVLAGRPVIYTTFLAYDEVAHHSGIERPDTLAVLRKVDQAIDRIAAAVEHAPRPYRLVVLSDHGQSQGATFRQRYGEGLEDIVGRFAGDGEVRAEDAHSDEGLASFNAGVSEVASRDTPVGHAVRTAAGKRLDDAPDPSIPEVSVMASGNLGIISFPREPGRVTLEQLAERRPGLLDALRAHPGIAFVLVRSEHLGPVVLGPRGPAPPARRPRRGRGPARAVRPVRRRPRPPHRRLPALPGHRRQQPLLGRAGGGRGVRGAGRLARRDGRRAGAPVRAAPARPAVAGGAARRRLRGRAPDPARVARAARPDGLRRQRASRARASRPASRARARHVTGELARRLGQQSGVAAPETDREERPPVDRHRDPRLDQRDRPRRALGVEVARAERRAPAPDRDQRDVDLPAQRAHAVVDVGVAREPHVVDQEAERVVLGAPGPGRGARRATPARRARSRRRSPAPRPPAPRAPCRTASRRGSARRRSGGPRSCGGDASRRSDGLSKWSWCRCESSTASTGPGSAGSGTWRSRCATRWRSTGSVISRAVGVSSSTVACPSQVTFIPGGRGSLTPGTPTLAACHLVPCRSWSSISRTPTSRVRSRPS